ncbi:hypothetical protein DL96DRAFT_1620076 [Flagelloscypha sp. PMI_526]|nr:hypothetical protein DL96DRAFT_1620076 [Flagelloscypha sp. PMI_526]
MDRLTFRFGDLSTDLARLILEAVALEDQGTAAVLCRLSKSTRPWIEPLLYRFVTLGSSSQAYLYSCSQKQFPERCSLLLALAVTRGWWRFDAHDWVYGDDVLDEILGNAPNLRSLRFEGEDIRRVHSMVYTKKTKHLHHDMLSSLTHGVPYSQLYEPGENRFSHVYMGLPSIGVVDNVKEWLRRERPKRLSHFLVMTQSDSSNLRTSIWQLKSKISGHLPPSCTACLIWVNFTNPFPTETMKKASNVVSGEWYEDREVVGLLSGRADPRILVVSLTPWPSIPGDPKWSKFLPVWPASKLKWFMESFGKGSEEIIWEQAETILSQRQAALNFSD